MYLIDLLEKLAIQMKCEILNYIKKVDSYLHTYRFIPSKVGVQTVGMEMIFIEKQALYLPKTVLNRCSDGRR